MYKNKLFLATCLLLLSACFGLANDSYAQCAMCRASIASTIANGEKLAANLNTGILYLAAMPYLLIMVIGWLWYKNSRKHHATLKRTQGLS